MCLNEPPQRASSPRPRHDASVAASPHAAALPLHGTDHTGASEPGRLTRHVESISRLAPAMSSHAYSLKFWLPPAFSPSCTMNTPCAKGGDVAQLVTSLQSVTLTC